MKHLIDRTFARLIGPPTIIAMLIGSIGCGQEGAADEVETVTSALNVGSMSQLAAMGTTGSYVLTTNLNASGTTWTPKTFSGTFDGANHTISNLTIDVSNGFNAGFFTTMLNATVKRVRFINLKVTGHATVSYIGGLAGWADSSLIEDVGVEVTVTANGAFTAGGILGEQYGGTINRSYAKGAVNGSSSYAGGLVGLSELGATSNLGTINQSYAAVTVAPNTSASVVYAGGILGYGFSARVTEVYAVGNVTGRASVGGLIGFMDCDPYNLFVFNHGIYRGNVTDMNRPPPAGWAGVIAGANNCFGRFDQFWWDKSLDGSTASYISPYVDPMFPIQTGYTTTDLKSPTTPGGGVYHWGDNNLDPGTWDAGTNQQHHALVGMPGGLSIQPR